MPVDWDGNKNFPSDQQKVLKDILDDKKAATRTFVPILPTALAKSGESLKKGVKLRILPFGNSITQGVGSKDGNGYRQKLWMKLSSKYS